MLIWLTRPIPCQPRQLCASCLGATNLYQNERLFPQIMQLHIHEQRWKDFTQSANDNFALQRYDAARVGYQHALAIAEALLEKGITTTSAPVRLVPMYVVSYQNLAECYRCLNEPIKQRDCLEVVHRRLIGLCQDPDCPLALRQQCMCDLPKTLMPLVHCLREQQPDRVAETVAHAKAVAAALLPGLATAKNLSFH